MPGAPSVLPAGPGRAVPEEVGRLVALMDGCRDDPEGLTAKITLVRSFITAQKGRANLIDVMCWLHLKKAVTINCAALLRHTKWQTARLPANADAVEDANKAGERTRKAATLLNPCIYKRR